MEKSYIQKITPFIDNMRVQVEKGTPVVLLYPFYNGQVLDWSEILFNKSVKPSYNEIEWQEEEGQKFAELLGIRLVGNGRERDTGVMAIDYSGIQIPGGDVLPEGSWLLGTAESMYPIYISNQALVDVFNEHFHYDFKVGWCDANNWKELELKYDAEDWEGKEPVTATISVDETLDVNGKYFGTIKPVNED